MMASDDSVLPRAVPSFQPILANIWNPLFFLAIGTCVEACSVLAPTGSIPTVWRLTSARSWYPALRATVSSQSFSFSPNFWRILFSCRLRDFSRSSLVVDTEVSVSFTSWECATKPGSQPSHVSKPGWMWHKRVTAPTWIEASWANINSSLVSFDSDRRSYVRCAIINNYNDFISITKLPNGWKFRCGSPNRWW